MQKPPVRFRFETSSVFLNSFVPSPVRQVTAQPEICIPHPTRLERRIWFFQALVVPNEPESSRASPSSNISNTDPLAVAFRTRVFTSTPEMRETPVRLRVMSDDHCL
jgi:hypothetical protein